MRRALTSVTFQRRLVVLGLVSLMSACAELDYMMKPRVWGLESAPGFNNEALVSGGVGESHVEINVAGGDFNVVGLETMLVAAVREKRPDIEISERGRYQIEASLIANDITTRVDSFESHTYKWSKRLVRVSYAVVDSETTNQVWAGIIETDRESLASYEVKKSKTTTDKVLDIVTAAVTKEDNYPYPSPPTLTEMAKLNFEGFVLNLPSDR